MTRILPGIPSGPLPSGFDLRSIPGLVSWLRSDLGVTLSAGKVSAWGDLSPLGTNGVSQATAAQQPTYVASGGANGRPYLDCGVPAAFNSLAFNTNVFVALTAGECFVVFNYNSFPPITGNGGLFHFGAAVNKGTFIPYTTGSCYEEFGCASRHDLSYVATPEVASPCVYNAATAPGNFTSQINGVTRYSTGVNTVTFDSECTLIDTKQGPLSSLNGRLYEFIMFNRVLSTTERTTVTEYAKHRYAIP